MDLDTYIITTFDRLEETLTAFLSGLPGQRRRRRGPAPTLTNSEVLTMEGSRAAICS